MPRQPVQSMASLRPRGLATGNWVNPACCHRLNVWPQRKVAAANAELANRADLPVAGRRFKELREGTCRHRRDLDTLGSITAAARQDDYKSTADGKSRHRQLSGTSRARNRNQLAAATGFPSAHVLPDQTFPGSVESKAVIGPQYPQRPLLPRAKTLFVNTMFLVSG